MAEEYGKYAFYGGLALAVVLLFVTGQPILTALIAIAGAVVGWTAFDDANMQVRLLFVIALFVAGFGTLTTALGGIGGVSAYITGFLTNLGVLFGSTGAVLLVKAVLDEATG